MKEGKGARLRHSTNPNNCSLSSMCPEFPALIKELREGRGLHRRQFRLHWRNGVGGHPFASLVPSPKSTA